MSLTEPPECSRSFVVKDEAILAEPPEFFPSSFVLRDEAILPVSVLNGRFMCLIEIVFSSFLLLVSRYVPWWVEARPHRLLESFFVVVPFFVTIQNRNAK